MDALRGAAALSIVVGHSYGLGGLRLADALVSGVAISVQVFFALSGFLLFRPMLAALARGEPLPSMRTFFRRRILRVVPAYWVALTLGGLLVPAGVPQVFGHHWWVFYFFGQAYSLTDNLHGLAQAWTLSVEASFYIALPLLASVAAALARRVGWERAAWLVVGPLLAVGPAVHVLNTIHFSSSWLVVFVEKITYGLPGEANFFAIGMALAIVSVRGHTPRLALRPTLAWGLAAGVYVLTAALFGFIKQYGGLDFRTRFIANDLLGMVFTGLALLPATFDFGRGMPGAVLRWRPLVFTGMVSYSLYLWHVPVGVWLLRHGLNGIESWSYLPRTVIGIVAVVAPSLVIATVSYRFVELPFLRRKETGAPVSSGAPA
jgi:peptidoglycan/LPS O-acetylase OafA/YrhL